MDATRLTGREPFHRSGKQLGPALLDFWRWVDSDLLSNTLRGRLAESLVAVDLGVADGTRTEWDPYDLQTAEGVTVEVKSAAYLQAWHQRRASPISFGIAPTLAWDPDTGEFGKRRKRQAQVYVFAVLGEGDQTVVDPLDVAQWRFCVLPTKTLNRGVGDQKTLSLGALLRLGPAEVGLGGINEAVHTAAEGGLPKGNDVLS